MRGDLLGPLERRVHRPRPAGREVIEVLRPADLVEMLEIVGELFGHAVEERILVEQADQTAFGRGAVIAHFIENEGVVRVRQLRGRLREADPSRSRFPR